MRNEPSCLVAIFLVVLIFLIFLSSAIVGWSTQKTFDGTISKTYVDGGNTFFVITKDGQTNSVIYENEDAWFFFKWNSGDLLRDLNVGQHYRFHTYGWRVPFFSWFPNIISAKPL